MANDISTKMTVNTSEGVANVTQLGDVTEATAKRMARATELLARQTAAQNKLLREQATLSKESDAGASASQKATVAAKAAVDAIQTASKATHEFSLANAGAAREMLVLFHEGVSGNMKRMAGSAMVMAQRMNALPAILGALTSPLTAVAAAVGLVGAAFISRESEMGQLANTIALTGNAAGLTAGQFDRMAASVAKNGAAGTGTAREAIMALASSGTVGAAGLEKMATVAVKVSELSGKSVQDVTAELSKAGSDVARFAREHENAWGAVSAAQYQAIVAAQKAGDTEGALLVYLDAMNRRLPTTATLFGTLGAEMSDAWAVMQKFVDPSNGQRLEDLDTKINGLFKRIADGRAAISRGEGNPVAFEQEEPALKAQLAKLTAARNALAASEGSANSKAMGQAKEEADRKAAAAASDYIDKLKEQGRAASTLREDLAKLADAKAKVEKNGGTVDKADYDAAVRGVNKAHESRDERKQDSAYTSTAKSLGDDNARLQSQIQSFKQYGRAVDETREAVLKLRMAEGGDLAGLSQPQKKKLTGLAQQADASANGAKDAETLANVTKMVDTYGQLTKAKELDARQAFIAQALDASGLAVDKQTNDALKTQADRLTQMASQRFTDNQAKANASEVKKRQESLDAEVDSIKRQNDALHETTLQREIGNDVAKLERQAAEDRLKAGADEVEIQKQLAVGIAAVTAARTAQYNDARNPKTQASSAAGKWAEQNTDTGSAAAKMTTSTLDTISSSIEKLTTTGKINFKDMWKSMADEFLSNIIRMQVSKAAGGVGSLFGSLFSAVDSAGGSSTTSTTPSAGDYSSVGLAAAFSGSGAAVPSSGSTGGFHSQSGLSAAISGAQAAGGAMKSAGSLFGSLFSAFTSSGVGNQDLGAGDYSTAGLNAAFGILSGARAEGGNINAGGTYLVGEKGPELFKASGAGTIVPNDELGGGSGGQNIHVGQGQVINVGQGVSRAEVMNAVSQANQQTVAHIQRLSSTGKLR